MATFTMTLQEIRENDPNETFGLDAYPIFDELHRAPLNQLILDHFWNREIAFETVSMFRLKMRTFMTRHMPLFNQLYESEKLKIDPMLTMKIETLRNTVGTTGTKNTETSTGDTTTHGEGKNVAMDTPQAELSEYGDYASGMNTSFSDSSVKQTGDGTSTSDTTVESDSKDVTQGFSQSQVALLMQYRQSFLNLDSDIIELIEQERLFMGIWATPEEFTRKEFPYGTLAYPLFPYRWI